MKEYVCGWEKLQHNLFNFMGISMTDLITVDEKFETISEKCADKILMDSLIIDYQDSTQSAVKNILKMWRYDIH